MDDEDEDNEDTGPTVHSIRRPLRVKRARPPMGPRAFLGARPVSHGWSSLRAGGMGDGEGGALAKKLVVGG